MTILVLGPLLVGLLASLLITLTAFALVLFIAVVLISAAIALRNGVFSQIIVSDMALLAMGQIGYFMGVLLQAVVVWLRQGVFRIPVATRKPSQRTQVLQSMLHKRWGR